MSEISSPAACVSSKTIAFRAAHRRGQAGLRRLVPSLLLALAAVFGTSTAHAAPPGNDCQEGVFCAWADEQFQGAIHRVDLATSPQERCVPLPTRFEASSFVNHTGRPVTVYQDARCSTEADFKTYPSGSFVPKAAYVARAMKIWSH